MTAAVIHRVTSLDLTCSDWQWPFATERRDDIMAHFGDAQRKTPELFNGRLLLGRNPVFAGDVFSASYFETDFASFLAWRDWGFTDKAVFNGFGSGALRASDGAYALGKMGQHTVNAGKVYFAAGTPDLNDLRGDRVDIAGSVMRETEEETGLTAADYCAADGWDVVVSGSLIAMIRILDVAMTGDALRARIEANLATQPEPELSAIHLVYDKTDFTPTMPEYTLAFLTAKL